MRYNLRQYIAALVILSIMILFAVSKMKGQDTLRIPLNDLRGAVLDKQAQIEIVLSGKEKGNVYYLQGQLDMLQRFEQIGQAQKALADSAKVKADSVKTAKKKK